MASNYPRDSSSPAATAFRSMSQNASRLYTDPSMADYEALGYNPNPALNALGPKVGSRSAPTRGAGASSELSAEATNSQPMRKGAALQERSRGLMAPPSQPAAPPPITPPVEGPGSSVPPPITGSAFVPNVQPPSEPDSLVGTGGAPSESPAAELLAGPEQMRPGLGERIPPSLAALLRYKVY